MLRDKSWKFCEESDYVGLNEILALEELLTGWKGCCADQLIYFAPRIKWARMLPRPNGMHAFFFSFLAQCLHRMCHEEALRLRGSLGRGVRAERSGALTVPNGRRGVQSEQIQSVSNRYESPVPPATPMQSLDASSLQSAGTALANAHT